MAWHDMQSKAYIYSTRTSSGRFIKLTPAPSTPSISPQMVNYQDPSEEVKDSGAYALFSKVHGPGGPIDFF